MDRYWLLTWTTYGTWLPGDDRGFVSNVDDGTGKGHRINEHGSKPASRQRGLQHLARARMTQEPCYLNSSAAAELLSQFQETASFRGWRLCAVAIMRNHIHLVVGVTDDPEPETLLRDFKSYGSRRLNRQSKTPTNRRWWTESGSRRKLPTHEAVAAAIEYVRKQHSPLAIWTEPSERGA